VKRGNVQLIQNELVHLACDQGAVDHVLVLLLLLVVGPLINILLEINTAVN
jgi:hypothetical protein